MRGTRLHRAAVGLAAGLCLGGGAAAQKFEEYKVKAALVVTFAKYFQWPGAKAESKDPKQTRDLILGVYGTNPFGGHLKQLDGRRIPRSNWRLKLRFFDQQAKDAELRACHSLFVSRPELPGFAALHARLKGAGVLLMTDSEGMAQRGAMVNLLLIKRRVKFALNYDSIRQQELKPAPLLAKLAYRRIGGSK